MTSHFGSKKGWCYLCDCITDTMQYEVVLGGLHKGVYIDLCPSCYKRKLKHNPNKYLWITEAGVELMRVIEKRGD